MQSKRNVVILTIICLFAVFLSGLLAGPAAAASPCRLPKSLAGHGQGVTRVPLGWLSPGDTVKLSLIGYPDPRSGDAFFLPTITLAINGVVVGSARGSGTSVSLTVTVKQPGPGLATYLAQGYPYTWTAEIIYPCPYPAR